MEKRIVVPRVEYRKEQKGGVTYVSIFPRAGH